METHYTSQPLTSQFLHSASIEKLDKSHFITSYIRAQSVHVGAYTVEGQTLTPWGQTDNNEPPNTPEEAHGFDTPVLKPRVSNPQKSLAIEFIPPDPKQHEEIRQPPKCLKIKAASGRPDKKTIDKTIQMAKNATESSKQTTPTFDPHGKRSSRKHMTIVDHDRGRVARLAERRDRKRAKRAIIKSTDLPKNDREDGSVTCEGKKAKVNQEKKPKIPAAFALMHGFSAANIGKNRLTLATPGVFNKGKASAKTRVVDIEKKKGRHNVSFSERAFLSKAHTKPSKRKRQFTNSSSSVSGSGSEYLPAAATVDTNRTFPKNEKSANTINARTKTRALPASQQSKCIAESDIWDIELEGPGRTELAKSVNIETIEDGTAITSTCGIQNAAPDVVVMPPANAGTLRSVVSTSDADREQADISAKTCSTRSTDVHSSPSLGPSQSASQTVRRGTLGASLPAVTSFSKYFPPLTMEPLSSSTCKHNNLISPEDSTAALDVIQQHPNTVDRRPDSLESVPVNSSDICCCSEYHGQTAAFMDRSYNLEGCLHVVPSPNSLQRAVEEYEAEDHIFNTFLNNERLDPRLQFSNNYESTFQGNCDNDFVLEPDQEIIKKWCSDYQEASEYIDGDTLPSRGGKLEWTGFGAYSHTDMVQDDDVLYGSVDYATMGEQPVQPVAQDYDEIEYLGEDELVTYEENRSIQRYHESSDYEELDGFCRTDLAIQLETRPKTDPSPSTSTSDDASDHEAKGSLLQQFTQGRTILGLHYDARYPSKFSTVLRAEADVAVSLKGHWLPQRL